MPLRTMASSWGGHASRSGGLVVLLASLFAGSACTGGDEAGAGGSAPSRTEDGGSPSTSDDDAFTGEDDGEGPPPDDGDTSSGGDTGTPLPDTTGRDASRDASGGTSRGTSQWVIGYYVGYQVDDYPIAQIDWTGLTHIVFGPMVVKADRSLDLGFDDAHDGQADARAIAKGAHASGVNAILMLGGAGAGRGIAAAADAAHRSALVTALLSAMDSLGYDGVDLDWEDDVDLDDLVALAQALRAARPSMVITYPHNPLNMNIDAVDARMVPLSKAVDRIDLMSYYPATAGAYSGWASWFNAPLSGASRNTPVAIDDSLSRFVAAGVAKGKLGMGAAFYAICYTGGIRGPRQTIGSGVSITGGDNVYPLRAFFAAGGTFATSAASAQKRDDVAQVPYLTFPSAVRDEACGSTQYISYEDEASLEAKGAFSKANGYGGIIVWTLNEGWLARGSAGGRAPSSLMQALRRGFLQ